MLSIRKTKTASGSTSVQIVYYKNRKLVVVKHIGSGSSNEEVELLIRKGKSWIEEKSFQIELFPIESKKELALVLSDVTTLYFSQRYYV